MKAIPMRKMTAARHRIIVTRVGRFALLGDGSQTLAATWVYHGQRPPRGAPDQDLLPSLSRRLEGYFRGEDVDFSDVPTPPGPAFFQRCWEACRSVRRGTTVTYAELARLAGSPRAARAAGQAMRHNQLAVIIPCHRVVASGGALHGYAGSVDAGSQALRIKRYLLALEGE